MARADEELEQRETYGNAPGWSMNTKEVPPDAAPKMDAVVESSTTDAEAESSPAQTSQEEVSQEATAPTSQPQPEKQFNMPPPERWEELRRQREQAEARAAQAEAMARLALEKIQSPQAQPEVDRYAGMDAQTAEFYRNQDKRIAEMATQIANQQIQPILQMADAFRNELAEIKVERFRDKTPEIKPDSPEEKVVAAFVSRGLDMTSAKKIALFDKQEAELKSLKTKQAQVPQKRSAAQSESSAGIPQTAGLPGNKGDWKQKAGEIIDKGGNFQDVLKSVFR